MEEEVGVPEQAGQLQEDTVVQGPQLISSSPKLELVSFTFSPLLLSGSASLSDRLMILSPSLHPALPASLHPTLLASLSLHFLLASLFLHALASS